jgi:hypothetical protein
MASLRATTETLWRFGVAGLSLGAAMVLLTACFGGGDKGPGIVITTAPVATPTETVVGSPEDAIARYVEEKGEEYAGDCAQVQQDQDAGKTCTAFQGEKENLRAYLAGITFSEFDIWLFVQKSDSQWSVVASQPFHPEAANIPGVPWPLAVGDKVVVVGTGDCLNVREGPGLEAQAVDCLPDGTEGVLAQGPIEEDGFLWWRLESRTGWVAADWLRVPEETP